MPLMNIYEPLFLLLALVTLLTWATAFILAVSGRARRAGRILRRWAIGAAIYFAVVIVVSAVQPRRDFALGEPQCFDDWCIAVVGRHSASDPRSVDVTLRVSSRAKRVPMGERGAAVYLTDAQYRRFEPDPEASDVPLDTVIGPGESFDTSRHFRVPVDAADLAIVYAHNTGFPIGWLIISEGGWFAKPPRMELN
jgi:hypothetical protein